MGLRLSKRVFVLGPSHHVYLDGCALTKCTEYVTPLGNLPIDLDSKRYLQCSNCDALNLPTAVAKLAETHLFSEMELQTDEDEHSIEMHLPYVRKVFEG